MRELVHREESAENLALPLKERERIYWEQEDRAEKAALDYQDARYIQGEQIYQIRQNKQYLEAKDKRGKNYHSFEDYCRQELGIGKDSAMERYRFYLVVEQCRQHALPEPQNPSQMKALEGVADEKLYLVWSDLVEAVGANAPRRELLKQAKHSNDAVSPLAYNTNRELREKIETLQQQIDEIHNRPPAVVYALPREAGDVDEEVADTEEQHVVLPDGTVLEPEDIQYALAEKERALELETKLSLSEQELEKLDDQIDEYRRDYAIELARLQSRLDEEMVKPDWLSIPDEAWAKAVADAKSERVKATSKALKKIHKITDELNDKFPADATDAIRGMGPTQAQKAKEALHWLLLWIDKTLSEVEEQESE